MPSTIVRRQVEAEQHLLAELHAAKNRRAEILAVLQKLQLNRHRLPISGSHIPQQIAALVPHAAHAVAAESQLPVLVRGGVILVAGLLLMQRRLRKISLLGRAEQVAVLFRTTNALRIIAQRIGQERFFTGPQHGAVSPAMWSPPCSRRRVIVPGHHMPGNVQQPLRQRYGLCRFRLRMDIMQLLNRNRRITRAVIFRKRADIRRIRIERLKTPDTVAPQLPISQQFAAKQRY
ncbi:hypothetical protein D3C76_1168600 [compost metagenome]